MASEEVAPTVGAAPDAASVRDGRIEWAVALLAGVALVLGPASPTGRPTTDAVLLLAAGTFAAWSAARAPWWIGVVVGVTLSAAAVAGGAVAGVVLGLVAAALSAVGRRWQVHPAARGAVVAALVVVAAAHLGSMARFGVSAVVGITSVVVWAAIGLAARPRRHRRVAIGVAVTALLAAAGAAGAAASQAVGARDDLLAGRDATESAVDLLGAGDLAAASVAFAEASAAFDRAATTLSSTWVVPAGWVPALAQNLDAGTDLVAAATSSTRSVAEVLATVDLDELRVRNGAIAVDAIGDLEAPLVRLQESLDLLAASIDQVSADPWVVGALTDRLDEVTDDVDAQRARSEDALRAVRQAPAMLGAEGRRVYVVALVSPAQLRGGGGAMDNWAEITADGGVITLTGFGRASDLDERAAPTRTLTGPAEWLAQWGSSGILDADGTVAADVWSRVTVSPDVPSTAQAIAELYPQSGGAEVDGVFVMDVHALAALLEITGPIEVAGLADPITAETAADYLLVDQFRLLDEPARTAASEQLARDALVRLFTSTLPTPPDLADLLSPLTHAGRLSAWMVRPAEQDLITEIGMDGALPDPGSGDGFTLALDNLGGNRIDVFLDGDAVYSVVDDGPGGVAATATVVLRNGAPAAGLPEVVIGNSLGLPTGTSRLRLSLYSTLEPVAAIVDGSPVDLDAGGEGGYRVASVTVEIPAGGSATVEVTFAGAGAVPGAQGIVVRAPSTVEPFTVTATRNGEEVVRLTEPGVAAAA